MDIALDTPQTKIATGKILLWLGIASMIMLFAGLTSGLVVRQAEGNWQHIVAPPAFYFSTAFILLSSITMQSAIASVKKNNLASVKEAIQNRGLIYRLNLDQSNGSAMPTGGPKMLESQINSIIKWQNEGFLD